MRVTKARLHVVASLLIVAALALLALGFARDVDALWQAGLVATGLAMGVAFATRWAQDPEPLQAS